MKRYEHPLIGDKSIFVRFRHGSRLNIAPEIRKAVQEVIPQLKGNPDHKTLFRTLIKDIGDGSGLGVHPESTWIAAVKEIFDTFERDTGIDDETKNIIIEYLSLLCTDEDISTKWDKLKQFLIVHIDKLSGWDSYKSRRGSFFGKVLRDKKGTYYMLRGRQRIEIVGTSPKTESEERFEHITHDVTNEYGRVSQLLRLASLDSISEEYTTQPEHFSNKVICNLGDNAIDTYYLRWRWYVLSEYDFMPILWRPRNCFADPVWLGYDLISTFAEEFPEHTDHEAAIPQDEANAAIEAFKGFPLQYEVALDTDLYLGDDKDVYFDFEDRKIRWINGTRTLAPRIVVPSKSADFSDGILISKKFLSALVREAKTPIKEITNVGTPKRIVPILKQPRVMGGLGIDPRYLLTDDTSKYSDKKWTALAYYKDGVNSNNEFYSFLSFYKLLQLAFDNDDRKVMDWINKNIDPVLASFDPKWKAEVLKPNMLPGNYLYGVGRNAAAHIEFEKGKTVNPDKPEDYIRVRRDLPIIRELATKVLDGNLIT